MQQAILNSLFLLANIRDLSPQIGTSFIPPNKAISDKEITKFTSRSPTYLTFLFKQIPQAKPRRNPPPLPALIGDHEDEQDQKSETPESKPPLEGLGSDDDLALHEAQVLQEFYDEVREITDNIGRPYDASREMIPSLAAYHPSFRNAEDACENIASEVVRRLTASNLEDPEMSQIVEDFKDKGPIVYQSVQKIGMIGDSGVGEARTWTTSATKANLPQEKAHC